MTSTADYGAAIEVLEEFLCLLPERHQERPGVIRAIEVLRHEPGSKASPNDGSGA